MMPWPWHDFEQAHLRGLPRRVVEEVRQVTAYARRHDEQTCEVRRLARAYLAAHGLTPTAAKVRALCALESGGTRGGGRVDPGGGARRHPAFAALPSRRSPAGAIWTAAIQSVAGRWAWGVNGVGELCLVVPRDEEDAEWAFVLVKQFAARPCAIVAARRAMRAAAYALWRQDGSHPESVHDHQAAAVIVAAATLLADHTAA